MKFNRKLNDVQFKTARVVELLLIFIAVSFLSSCSMESSLLPVPQEMGNMALLRTFAVDLGEDENWKVTVSTGKQGKGLQGEQESPLVLSGESASLIGACRQLESLTDHTVFYGYVDQLVVGMDVGKDGVNHLLEYFASQSSLSLGTGIWIVDGVASDLLTEAEEEGAEVYLDNIITESKLGTQGMTRKIGQVMTEIREQNSSFVPILGINEQNGLEETGYALFSGEQYVARIEGEKAQGLNLLLGQDQLIELEQVQGVFAVNLSPTSVTYQGDWQVENDQKLNSVVICLDLQGKLLEFSSVPQGDELKVLEIHGEEMVVALCEKILSDLQKHQTDLMNLKGHLSTRNPSQSRYLEEHWEEIFPSLDIQVKVDITLEKVNGI